MPDQKKQLKFIGFALGIFLLLAIVGAIFLWQKYLPENQKIVIKQSIDSLTNALDLKHDDKEIILPPKTKFLYKKGYDIYIFDTATTSPSKHILSSDLLKDFSLSPDGKFMAYTIKETGFFSDNSDAYLVDLEKNKVKRLDPKNNIATLNPKIFPDNSKVAFVRREYSTSTKSVSDGEIWIIDADANASSSKKLFEAKKLTGLADEKYCVTDAEKKSIKIGLTDISPDGKTIAYWSKDWAIECSGLWEVPYFSNLDGSNFLSEEFISQNTFSYDTDDDKKYNWEISQIHWVVNGDFIVLNYSLPPLYNESIYYYDKKQNKIGDFYNGLEKKTDKYGGIKLKDIIIKSNGNLMMIHTAYENQSGLIKYFADEIKNISETNLSDINLKEPFITEAVDKNTTSNIRLLNENMAIYSKRISDKAYGLFLYDFQNKTEQKIDEAKSEIKFEF